MTLISMPVNNIIQNDPHETASYQNHHVQKRSKRGETGMKEQVLKIKRTYIIFTRPARYISIYHIAMNDNYQIVILQVTSHLHVAS
jgi:hypothetical protein